MYRASLLLSQSLYGSWSRLQDVSSWAAVDDAVWGQFAKNLGDESLDNTSAIEATQGSPISRTKFRLVFAVARMMFDMDLADVGVLPVAASAGSEPKTKAARANTGLTLKIKVSSILDQSSDREVEGS